MKCIDKRELQVLDKYLKRWKIQTKTSATFEINKVKMKITNIANKLNTDL
jgi:hypothetical protein